MHTDGSNLPGFSPYDPTFNAPSEQSSHLEQVLSSLRSWSANANSPIQHGHEGTMHRFGVEDIPLAIQARAHNQAVLADRGRDLAQALDNAIRASTQNTEGRHDATMAAQEEVRALRQENRNLRQQILDVRQEALDLRLEGLRLRREALGARQEAEHVRRLLRIWEIGQSYPSD